MTTKLMKQKFPSPTGVTYYEFCDFERTLTTTYTFPSPTGVTYYELRDEIPLDYIEKIVSVPNRGYLL